MSHAKSLLSLAASALLLAGATVAHAQSPEDFYRGKTIDMVIGYAPGGSNDLYARIVSEYMSKYIPGNPTIVPRNMPGAGSLVAANDIYNRAAKDGTVIGLVAATLPLDERLGAQGIMFESAKFNWIGRIATGTNVTMIWHTSPVKTFEDALEKETVLAATGASSTVTIYPTVMNNVLGTKFKLIKGYKGSAEAMLAMERGEAEGHSTSLAALQSSHPDWIKDGKVRLIVQYALNREPSIPDVPTAIEVAKTPEQKQVLRIVMNATEIGKSVLAPPDMPAERVKVLRDAFSKAVQDPEFVAALEKARLDMNPMSGADLQALVEEVGGADPAVIEKVREIYPRTE
ncbi:Bug family tripartite tricarboxylate transporter substrate binding protein [Propylenella binzhouense]|uniref:Tripartite-type tricarboxylate transporter receptor subunit TctC n=1 Tax=Propylenella binzhouense TaxID=2555902 RepID=A0A964T894_9HYPH|nr:tripartite tricarboxylate transporter substrate-binding protein [Propylenella binzhouense]MYZ50371.1 hypothetical protein [Propylenella binzhouense]